MDERWLSQATRGAVDAFAVIDELPRAIIVTATDAAQTTSAEELARQPEGGAERNAAPSSNDTTTSP